MNVDTVDIYDPMSDPITHLYGCFDPSDINIFTNLPMNLDTSACPIDLVVGDVEDTIRVLRSVLLVL